MNKIKIFFDDGTAETIDIDKANVKAFIENIGNNQWSLSHYPDQSMILLNVSKIKMVKYLGDGGKL